jgi:hypothetical protein
VIWGVPRMPNSPVSMPHRRAIVCATKLTPPDRELQNPTRKRRAEREITGSGDFPVQETDGLVLAEAYECHFTCVKQLSRREIIRAPSKQFRAGGRG